MDSRLKMSHNCSFSLFHQGHSYVKLTFFSPWAYSDEDTMITCTIGATALLQAKMPAILHTLVYISPVQMSVQWKSHLTFQHYYKNSFDAMDVLKDSWGAPGFMDHFKNSWLIASLASAVESQLILMFLSWGCWTGSSFVACLLLKLSS